MAKAPIKVSRLGRSRAELLRTELERLRAIPSPARSPVFYISMIFGLSVLAVGSVLAVIMLRPQEDNGLITTGIFGFLGPSIVTILAVMVRDVHRDINSRMDALLEATERAATAEGKAEGKAESRTS